VRKIGAGLSPHRNHFQTPLPKPDTGVDSESWHHLMLYKILKHTMDSSDGIAQESKAYKNEKRQGLKRAAKKDDFGIAPDEMSTLISI
jgi:hypothetical protein